MADNITTTTEVDPAVAVFYDRVLLLRAKPKLIFDKFADRKPLPKKSGKTIKFRMYSQLSRATTPLSESITPNGQKLAKVDRLATVSQFGSFVEISDVVDLTVEDPVLTIAAEECGDQMGRTLDWLLKVVLISSASSTTCSNGDPTATLLNKIDIDAVVQILLGNDASFITSMVKAGPNQGTAPIRPAFWTMAHTDLINDLEKVTGFKSTSQYPNQKDVDDAEWGSTGNLRWLMSSVAHDPADDAETYYNCPIIAKHAYAVVDITGGNAKNIVKGFGSAGTADPLNQRATSAWKVWFVARILNDNFMHVLKCSNG